MHHPELYSLNLACYLSRPGKVLPGMAGGNAMSGHSQKKVTAECNVNVNVDMMCSLAMSGQDNSGYPE